MTSDDVRTLVEGGGFLLAFIGFVVSGYRRRAKTVEEQAKHDQAILEEGKKLGSHNAKDESFKRTTEEQTKELKENQIRIAKVLSRKMQRKQEEVKSEVHRVEAMKHAEHKEMDARTAEAHRIATEAIVIARECSTLCRKNARAIRRQAIAQETWAQKIEQLEEARLNLSPQRRR